MNLKSTLLLTLIFLPVFGFGQTQVRNPSTTTATGGGAAFSNPDNVGASDDTYTTGSITVIGEATQTLNATGFGFSVPTSATIDGISARVERGVSGIGIGIIQDATVRLIKAGAASGNDKALTTTWPDADSYQSYGGAADLWGNTLSPTDVNAANFGLAFQGQETSVGLKDFRVDHIELTAHYTNNLPVVLTRFEGKAFYGGIMLEWETAQEVNSDHFVVERAYESAFYESVGMLAAQEYSQQLQKYVYRDWEPNSGINIYRLKQVDKDGTFEYSNQIELEFTPQPYWYTTLSQDGNTLYLHYGSSQSEQLQYRLINLQGQILAQGKLLPKNQGNIAIDVSALSSGQYILNIKGQSRATASRIQKQ